MRNQTLVKIGFIVVGILAFLLFLLFVFRSVDNETGGVVDLPPGPEAPFEDPGEAAADSLLSLVIQHYEDENFDRAREVNRELQERFGDSLQARQAANLLANLEGEDLGNQVSNYTPPVRKSPQQPRNKIPATTPSSRKQQGSTIDSDVQIVALEERIAQNELELQLALRKMRIVRDDRQGITYYYNKHISHYVHKNSLELYIVEPDDLPATLRMRIYYNGDQWLDIQRYEIYADDREYNIRTNFGDRHRGSGKAGSWEWYDLPVAANEMRIANAVKNAARTAIRHIGNVSVFERTMTEDEKLRLVHVLRTFDALTLRHQYLSTTAE